MLGHAVTESEEECALNEGQEDRDHEPGHQETCNKNFVTVALKVIYTPVRTEEKKPRLAITKKILSGSGWRTGRAEAFAKGPTGSAAVAAREEPD
jgi:hypothetical protein